MGWWEIQVNLIPPIAVNHTAGHLPDTRVVQGFVLEGITARAQPDDGI